MQYLGEPARLRARSGRFSACVGALALTLALTGCSGSRVPNTSGQGGSMNGGGTGSSGVSQNGGSTGGSSGGQAGGGNGASGDGASIYLNIVPPGSNGNSAGGIGLQGNVASYPANFKDQDVLYGDLSYAKSPLKVAPCTPPTDISQHVKASDLACDYFKHEGLTPDTVASTETLTTPSGAKVTITRDQWGVPFIDAPTRAAAMYGVGYANGEDRLWLDDVLRHVGRGMITQFIGDAPGVTSFDADLAETAGYSDQELTNMVNATVAQLGPLGPVFRNDADQFVAGLNAYIQSLTGANVADYPPEYLTLKPAGGLPIKPFTVDDIVASAILIQSIFATGGGGEITNELLLQKLDPGFTAGATSIPADVCKLWRDLRNADDPNAPTTIVTHSAHESPGALDETCPQTLPPGAAVWDVGSLKARSPLQIGTLSIPATLGNVPGLIESLLPGLQILFPGGDTPSARAATPFRRNLQMASAAPPPNLMSLADDLPLSASAPPRRIQASLNPLQGAKQALRQAGIAIPNTTSNWIVVNADQTADGHPIAVMGPQTSYFVPELLWEFAVHSHGGTPLDVDGRGIATAMLPYIEIGRGKNYAWSATSGEGDLVDTRVSYLCNTDGSAPSLTLGSNGFPQADGYEYDAHDGKGPQCRRFYERVDSWTTALSPAAIALGGSPTPETAQRYIMRTHYGPVIATATVGGRPVAISQQRSTFYNELSTAAPFALADTGLVTGPRSFQQIFNGVTGTFNWLYVDSQHDAYIQSGLLPVRNPGQSPDLPVWGNGDYEWQSDADFVNGAHADYFTGHGGLDPATDPLGADPGADLAYPSRVVAVQQGNVLQTGYFEFADYLPMSAHPLAIDPARGYMASWNNKPAPGWWAADDMGSWGPTHRVAMLLDRLAAFKATGRKFDFANMVNIMSDAAYTDLRGQAVLPLLLEIMQKGALTADQQQVVTLMQNWLDGAPEGTPDPSDSSSWIGGPGDADLGAFRRDTHPDNGAVYDSRAAVVLMDAWYPQLVKALLPQMTAIDPCNPATGSGGNGLALQSCYDAPRAQGSAYQAGWFEEMKRVLEMTLDTPGHVDYRALECAGTGTMDDCRNGVLTALTDALSALGGLSNEASWDGTQLPSAQYGSSTGHSVEDYDSIRFTDFSLLGVPIMPWENRPTFQQVVEVRN